MPLWQVQVSCQRRGESADEGDRPPRPAAALGHVRDDGQVLRPQRRPAAVHPGQGGRGRLYRLSEGHHVFRRGRGLRRDRAGL